MGMRTHRSFGTPSKVTASVAAANAGDASAAAAAAATKLRVSRRLRQVGLEVAGVASSPSGVPLAKAFVVVLVTSALPRR